MTRCCGRAAGKAMWGPQHVTGCTLRTAQSRYCVTAAAQPHHEGSTRGAHYSVSHAGAHSTPRAAPLPAISNATSNVTTMPAADVKAHSGQQTSTTRQRQHSPIPPGSSGQQRLQHVEAGVAADKGSMKSDMQDHHVVVPRVAQSLAPPAQGLGDGMIPSLLTGVFDGHGGSSAAQRAATMLRNAIQQDGQLWSLLAQQRAGDEWRSALQCALAHVVGRVDRELLDQDRAKLPHLLDGTTALLGLQVGLHLVVTNVGDSRAVLRRRGVAQRLSEDHKPGEPAERARITQAGGTVSMHNGSWRVVLNRGPGLPIKVCDVSRTLGDLEFKSPAALISCEPDVVHQVLQPDDELVVYATDGLWTATTDQTAVDIAMAAYKQATEAGLPAAEGAQAAAAALVRHAREQGSVDDVTVVVTPFTWV